MLCHQTPVLPRFPGGLATSVRVLYRTDSRLCNYLLVHFILVFTIVSSFV